MDPYNDSASSFQYQQASENGVRKPPPAYHAALHSVRKIPARNIITKKPIQAPLPPTHPKVYKVDPIDFRDVVQKLTGAECFQPARLREAAPPPLSLSPRQTGTAAGGFPARGEDVKSQKSVESPIGFSMSPSSLAWCTAMLLSPRPLSSLEPSAAL
ncbi:VQ motif-containing family protein [Striga asiatica]|uniref:VQ motif-containing family protein n=1 Tax=Striga asiatica TaxID=4170 RepID=A0A5A7PFF9_STRAF|nr:VQ motif-containing family protein [Striga asiatica]